MTTKKASKKSNIAPLVLDFILMLIGISLFIWADRVTSAISIALGAIFLIYAIYDFIAYARLENKDDSNVSKIITAVALSVAGIFLIMQHSFLKELISIIVGIAIIIISILKIQDAIQLKSRDGKYQTALIFACIGLLCGILCIAGRIIIPDVILKVLGIFMIIFAFADITSSFSLKRGEKTIEDTAIEAEIVKK